MKTFKLILYYLSILLLFSCNNDSENISSINPPTVNNPETFLQNFGNTIQRNFLGRVVDIHNNPIEDVRITIGNNVAFTDSNGVFNLENASILNRFGYVKAEKAGYIHGSRAIIPSEGTNKITIILLEETVAGTTTSGETETISISNGASVQLNGDYIKEDGTSYEGNVNVILHHLDPTDENMINQMPGMLLAANSEDEAVMLKTLGMLAVELRGVNGEDLNLAENSTAEIRIPVASELLSEAPNTIPLWYFDEENGYWIEEGEAQLIGNEYVGTVTHFSFWNCDLPIRYTDLCINLTDIDGNPISNTKVELISTTSGTSFGITNTNGQICGIIPSDETLTMNVIHECDNDNPVFTSTIGPYTAPATTNITIETSAFTTETIQGDFLDCDGYPVTDGYVIIGLGDEGIIQPIINGIIDFNVLRCFGQNTFTFRGIDNTNEQTTDVFTYSFNEGVTNIGIMYACEGIETYITYQIDDDPVITYTEDLIYNYYSPSSYRITPGYSPGSYEGFRFDFFTEIPGVYSTANNQVVLYTDIDANGNKLDSGFHQNTISVNIITADHVNKTADIAFYGTYIDNTGEHTITGRIFGNGFQ